MATETPLPAHESSNGNRGGTVAAHGEDIDCLSDSLLIPAVAVFFEKLHSIIPIFTRSWLLERIANKEHQKQKGFAGMLLALCALTKVQPGAWKDDTARLEAWDAARLLLEKSARVRSSATMGSKHTLDDVLASLYAFCTLTGLQDQDAFIFRLSVYSPCNNFKPAKVLLTQT